MRKNKLIFLLIILLLSATVKAQDIPKVKITEIEKRIAESKGPLIINFWATFCKPCVEEMPHFQKLADAYAKDGVQLIFVSLDLEEDFPVQVNSFVHKLNITSPVVWLDEFDADYFCPKIDSSWSGSLPSTLFVNNQKNYRHFKEQVLTETQLKQEIDQMIAGRDDQ